MAIETISKGEAEKIIIKLLECDGPVRFFYSGLGNKKDGAMCFNDGVITCEDFAKLVENNRTDIEGNDLYITLDSSYSFHWT